MFTSDLVVSSMVGTRSTFKVKEDLHYKFICNEGFKEFIVPKGFVYDGASIPSILNSVLPRFGYKYDRASCLHDWLYATADSHQIARKDCDYIFKQAMLDDKVNKNLANLIYLAVRLFGAKYYGGNVIIKE